MAAVTNALTKPAVRATLVVNLGFARQPTPAAPKTAALTPLVMFVALVLAEVTVIMVIVRPVLVVVLIVATINVANLVVPVLVRQVVFLMDLFLNA
jgi:hypothetical protein